MKYVAIALLKLYKATLSKWKGGKKCIFTPSCSVYSMEAYEKFGFFKGSWLTFKRLLRCAPWVREVSTRRLLTLGVKPSGTCDIDFLQER